MRCSTCGERLEGGSDRCPTCGAGVPVGSFLTRLGGGGGIPRCPRCGHRGDGIGYFRRPGHLALLMGVSLVTYGVGGLVYWLLRRKDEVCPNCGLRLTYGRESLPPARATPSGAVRGGEERVKLPRGGLGRRILGTIFILAALLLFGIGFAEWEPVLFTVGGVSGAAGTMSFWWGLRALRERREAVSAAMERQVLRLAARSDGTLTVTEVAASLDLSLPAAEKILIAMDDGFRVRSEITDRGVIVYEFPEVKHRRHLDAGEG